MKCPKCGASMVFPTCVGVDQHLADPRDVTPSIPHVRGGGPIFLLLLRKLGTYSPRAWGWTVARSLWTARRKVFPTCVGVDRPR